MRFNRYFFAQAGRDGVIVDERFNGGGLLADHVIDYLRQPIRNYATTREGDDQQFPTSAIPGPKVMLINEQAGSGGDYMPYTFRQAGLGPLIGKRTWGGLVGIGGYPPLIDGGGGDGPAVGHLVPQRQVGRGEPRRRAGHRGRVRPEGRSGQGKDPQLEKAIEFVHGRTEEAPGRAPAAAGVPELLQAGREGPGGREVNRMANPAREWRG